MMAFSPNPVDKRLNCLDLARGLAAIAVCAGHLRSFIFVDWTQIQQERTWPDHLFYFFTGLGDQAVVVFFVMSGFLVGGSIASAWENGTWSATKYSFRRIARLETVLIPALLLTLFWDCLGKAVTNDVGYDGSLYQFINSGPSVDKSLSNDPVTFWGNITFLMTIAVPIYGTNGPLWSLANEFWYYVIFPLAWISLHGSAIQRVVCVVTIAMIAVWLPRAILLSGTIWLFGYGAWYVGTKPNCKSFFGHPLWLAGTSVSFLISLFGSKTAHWFGTDVSVGFAFALLVTALAVRKGNSPSPFGTISKALAGMSYTLYLFHFPFLSFIWFSFFAPQQFHPGVSGYGLFAIALSITLAYAYVMWWCFERHTDKVRGYLERWCQGA